MYRLPSIILLVVVYFQLAAQSPHGELFKKDCATCHNSEGWAISIDTFTFNHDTTRFQLFGLHEVVDCKSCHETLVFDQTPMECASCHVDMHSMSVGNDCARCHTSNNWLVDNIPELHEENGFALSGVHSTLSCIDCHFSETDLRFDRIGNDCINCHRTDFMSTTNPEHASAGFSENCIDCHSTSSPGWETDIINHDFFPLTLGHEIQDCNQCHTTANFSDTSPDCASCHQTDFDNTLAPNHLLAEFSTDCITCHTTEPDWQPASFLEHDNLFFPIYTGEHEGVWNDCIDCHTSPENFTINTCVNCHINPETDNVHDGVNGYTYTDDACIGCHPSGNTEMIFDHNNTLFPLTGAHIDVDCIDCHSDGFQNTPSGCIDCHDEDFKSSLNPNHNALGLSSDCIGCHTTDPGWEPAKFEIHDEYYPLTSAHSLVKNDCQSCHNGDYNNTPNTCVGCHVQDFNQSVDPDHQTLNLSTDCVDCHTTDPEWMPASFDIHNDFYALLGAHALIASDCASCHEGGFNNTPTTCIGCHQENFISANEPDHVSSNFSTDCIDCHSQDAWIPSTFDHNATGFPLTKAHISVDCIDCHSDGYQNTPTDCVDCHLDNFNQSREPNHQVLGFSTDCILCHTTDPNWEPASFDDHDQIYPLNGAHALISGECLSCHADGYTNTPNTCVGCHQTDYNNTEDPDHLSAGFPTDCIDCHSETAWEPATFDHDQIYPLNGAHALISGECLSCHADGYTNTPNTCVGCHQTEYNNTEDPDHLSAGFPTDCIDCHSETAWEPATFDHDQIYPLNGAHATISGECLSCHADGYANTPNTCVGCHQTDYNNTEDPDHLSAGFPTDCIDCHSETAWEPATFDHDQIYPLNGAHAVISGECLSCHADGYTNTPNTCVGCHQTDYNNTEDPDHLSAGFPTDCIDCHSETAWEPATFDHDQIYPLNGAHATISGECLSCHADGYANTPNTCVGCHQTDYNNTEDPDHLSAGFPTDCIDCHSETAWEPATFDHDQIYPLNGAHATISGECLSCHADGYTNTPNTCVGCHQTDYNNTEDPDHLSAGFSTDCIDCHSETAWEPATFDHDQIYPLNGAHASIANDCDACHDGGFTNTPNTCVGCHRPDYNNTRDPNHLSAGFSTDCIDCHSETAWEPATFDHDQIYPLNGAHATISGECLSCHADGYTNTPNTCVGCHQTDYNNTEDPDHLSAGFSTDCIDCHSETAWEPATFDHDQIYPLNGAHASIANDCDACHDEGFTNTPNTCVGCHRPDYNNTRDPNHLSAGFSTDCIDCHSETAWEPAEVNHDAFYPLNGAHASIANDCDACHDGGFTNTPNTCVGCHRSDYNNTRDPNHLSAGFSTDCIDCHSETSWEPAEVNHDAFYPLNGAHASIANDCDACHSGGFTNTPNTCVGCHRTEYNNTRNPNHFTSGFSTDCIDCHSETAWEPAEVNHDAFYPLNGAHASIANDCDACHTGGFSNTPNTCVGCHRTDFDNTRNPDHRASGFSTDCLDCHGETSWVPADINHDAFYPLNGAHASIANDCDACHTGGFGNTPNTCVGCHQSEYNNTNDPDHQSAGFPITCEDCHGENAWTPATFDHDALYFPIYSGNHREEWNDCTDCHITGNTSSFSCINCHEHNNRNEVDDDHEDVPGYTYESNACLACHPTGDE